MFSSVEFPANDAICIYRNALPDELCDDLIELFKNNSSVIDQSIDIKNKYSGSIKSIYLLSPDSESPDGVKTELDIHVFNYLRFATDDYQSRFTWLSDCPEILDSGYRIQLYSAGVDKYDEHIDGDPWSLAYQGRICGVVMYLNDVEDGGETYFPVQDIAIKPEKGSIAIFPANWTHPHEARIPISEDKYVIATFLNSARFRHRNNYFVENSNLYY